MSNYRGNLMICGGTGCIATGGLKVKDALEDELKAKGLAEEFKVVITGCNGFCAAGPILTVYPEGIFYEKLKIEDLPLIVEEHLLKGRPVEKFMYQVPDKPGKVPTMNEIPFFNLQVLRALRNKGMIDPEKIEDYIARDGYMAAGKALTGMSREEVSTVVKESGLRGRGGAGFNCGLKWEFCRGEKEPEKFIICNGDEGDPGAFMDRSIMEADPHVVLEGMLIGAYAIDAHLGYIYVRAEYPLAVARLQLAIDQALEMGLLGKDIFGTGFDFEIIIYQGAGAFVCGESTALMKSIEGKRGMPRPTPPRSVQQGLWKKPSVLNNVETLACVPQIILNGSDWFRTLGTEKSTGTKVFALTGSVNNIGLIEVPMGIPLRQIIFEIGGGLPKKRKFKAVQLGGPSGGCVPEHLLDTPVTFEDIVKTGAIVGSGGMVVMDDLSCMVAIAKFFLEFTTDESCGKCPPCRVGTKVMLEMLEDIAVGKGKPEDIATLGDLSQEIIDTSLCGLGQSAPNPVLTTIKYFLNEYEEHINEGYCRAGVCTDLVTFYIDEEKCKACKQCKKVCPVDAIIGEKKVPHRIDQEKCIKCRSCFEICKFGSVKTGPASLREKLIKDQAVEA
ncbi:MAG: NADH-quinone oxidoreductase subunit NuoF [Thermodesulfovibrionales bacterium]|nr:NADH-quinone oxidoreductase subunit NuoF [Thermodesulfovibrionales bacterium]